MKKGLTLTLVLATAFLIGCTTQNSNSINSSDNITQSSSVLQQFTISFSIDGVITTQTVNEGEKVSQPEDPSKKDYLFTGWYTDELCENLYDFNSPVNSSFTLYAGFEEDISKKTWTVTFDLDGGVMDSSATQTIKNGMTATKPTDPKKDGCTFKGWFTSRDGTKEFDFSTPITENVTIYAIYEEIIINALFDVTASSQASLTHKADCAVDGSEETYWEASSNESQSLTIDLGQVKSVSKVNQEFKDLATWNFDIKGSIDGEKYVTLNHNETSGTKYEMSVTGYYRYICLEIAANDTRATSVEFSVEAEDLSQGSNIAYGMKGVACCWSGAGGYEPEAMFDGNLGNFHCANSNHANHYMGIDLTTPYYVTSLEFYLPDATDHKFIIDYADANGAWHNLENGDYSNNVENSNHYKIEVNKEILAILVHHNGNSTGNWPAINEMMVYGFRNNTTSSSSQIIDNKEVYDLGEISYVGKIAINDKSGTDRVIETSLDGTIWNNVSLEDANGDYINVNKDARYVRFSDSRNEITQGNISIYSQKYTRNLAIGTKPTATTRSGDPGFWENMMTFNEDCKQAASRFYCSTGSLVEEINLDLGNICLVDEISYKWQDYANDPVYSLKIEVSNDKENWSTLYDTASLENGVAAGQVFVGETTIENELVRYVRITAHHTTGYTNCNTLIVKGVGSPIV